MLEDCLLTNGCLILLHTSSSDGPEDEFSGETLHSEINGIFDQFEKQDADKENEDKRYAIWRDELAIFFTWSMNNTGGRRWTLDQNLPQKGGDEVFDLKLEQLGLVGDFRRHASHCWLLFKKSNQPFHLTRKSFLWLF